MPFEAWLIDSLSTIVIEGTYMRISLFTYACAVPYTLRENSAQMAEEFVLLTLKPVHYGATHPEALLELVGI